jgi:hypothetical protein
MTSFRQIAANRRNASKSTGPTTEEGKQRSRFNAVRHGLTAETVIGALEDAEDYKAFEGAITADYDAQSAVERELLLRLAGLLWRLRRATTIETGLFEIQAGHLSGLAQYQYVDATSRQIVHALFGQPSVLPDQQSAPSSATAEVEMTHAGEARIAGVRDLSLHLARCFLRLADLPNFALDRLSRYEGSLWRQVGQTLFTLDSLDRRKPQERRYHLGGRNHDDVPADDQEHD